MKNAYNYPYCHGVIICRCIILFRLQKLAAQMLNKLRNKESDSDAATWRQIRCKRNKVAVDKAFMPHSGKCRVKTPPKRSLGYRENQ